MRKIILTLLILSQFSCNGQTNNEIEFNVRYTPETIYYQTVKQTSSNEIKYSGSDKFLNDLKEKGVQNPTVTNQKSTMESVTRTEKMTEEKIPMTMEFVKTSNANLPDGTIIYGYCIPNRSMPVLDSVVSEAMDKESKQMLLNGLQSTFEQFSLPNKRLKVGDSFSQDSPLSIPIADVTVDMTVTTNYELIEIRVDTAEFKIIQVYTMTSTSDQYTVDATGNGKGKMLYLISKNFYSKYQMDIEMELKMEVNGIKLDMNTISGFTQDLQIERKKASR